MWFASKYLFTLSVLHGFWLGLESVRSRCHVASANAGRLNRTVHVWQPTKSHFSLVKCIFLLVTTIHYFFTLQLHEWQNCTELSAVWWILLQWRNLSPGPRHQPTFLSVSHCLMAEGKKKNKSIYKLYCVLWFSEGGLYSSFLMMTPRWFNVFRLKRKIFFSVAFESCRQDSDILQVGFRSRVSKKEESKRDWGSRGIQRQKSVDAQ